MNQLTKNEINNKSYIIVFISAIYFCTATIVVHFLRPDLNIFSRGLSNYAVGKYGIIMKIGFLSMAVSEITLAINLLRSKKCLKNSAISFILAGIGISIVVFLPALTTDPISINKTIHCLGALAQGAGFIAAVLFLCKHFKNNYFRIYSKTIGFGGLIIILLGSAFYIYENITAEALSFLGIIQKISLVISGLWLIAASLQKEIFETKNIHQKENNNSIYSRALKKFKTVYEFFNAR